MAASCWISWASSGRSAGLGWAPHTFLAIVSAAGLPAWICGSSSDTQCENHRTLDAPEITQNNKPNRRLKLWEISGHANYYRENMFGTMDVENDEYQLKPMNCPGHILIYKSRARSYRELPMRLAELGTVYRYERSGVMHGLMRVRGFTQDDAHIFCMQ